MLGLGVHLTKQNYSIKYVYPSASSRPLVKILKKIKCLPIGATVRDSVPLASLEGGGVQQELLTRVV